jgi:hypothetical protein
VNSRLSSLSLYSSFIARTCSLTANAIKFLTPGPDDWPYPRIVIILENIT